MKYHVFTSYSHQDKDEAQAITGELVKRGFCVWRDDRIDWGAEFPAAIENTILDSQALMVIVPESSVRLKWIMRETRLAPG